MSVYYPTRQSVTESQRPQMIDLRSDTVTQPTDAMRQAMSTARVGDDVFGEDPTVGELESRVAELLGKEAALFVSSGTMGNQLGVRVHCRPGDEFLCEDQCHIYHYEQAAYAQLFGVATQPLMSDHGLPTIESLAPRVRGADQHHPRTKMLALENTHNRHGGVVLDPDRVAGVCEWAHGVGLACHLDGARLWNASAATGLSMAALAAPFDTVSVCFSKGLGAPVGSALVGPKDLVAEARRTRKALGGGTRQAGILAAAALHAIEHHFPNLADDHAKADVLRAAIRQAPGLALVEPKTSEGDSPPLMTNLVYFDVNPQIATAEAYYKKLLDLGVGMFDIGPQRMRAVTHLGVTREEVERAGAILLELAESST